MQAESNLGIRFVSNLGSLPCIVTNDLSIYQKVREGQAQQSIIVAFICQWQGWWDAQQLGLEAFISIENDCDNVTKSHDWVRGFCKYIH